MMQSAAIIKVKNLAPWRELRIQKRKDKKLAAIERKANKVSFPSPMRMDLGVVEVPETDEPTRDEMLEQAELMGLKVDKRWSDATLLKHIEEPAWATQKDNS